MCRLAKDLLGQQAKLVLSCEWEYSPYIYHSVPQLPDFALLGLPASESGNPLLLPLAGHEFGHSLWAQGRLRDDVLPPVQTALIDNIRTQRWADHRRFYGIGDPAELTTTLLGNQSFVTALDWALAQAEETFCDFLGLRIFGPSFAEAHVFLLTPAPGGLREPRYPNGQTRLGNLDFAAKAFGFAVRADLLNAVEDDQDPFTSQFEEANHYQLELADAALAAVLPDLCQKARDRAGNCAYPDDDSAAINRILDRFEVGVPASDIGSLPLILAAGWACLVNGAPVGRAADEPQRAELLRELVLKSLEILEVEDRVS